MRRRLASRSRKPSLKRKKAETRPKTPRTQALRPPPAGRRAEFLTPTETADRLLVAAVTVRLWAKKGLLPSVTTLGGHRRFRAEDVDAFAAQHQPIPGRQRPTRVLIIDDDPEFSRYLAGMIAANAPGVVVDVANDGFSAGVNCRASRPDVVTLDLQMPDMDGFEVCAMLRTMFGRSTPRIVALTGFSSEKNARRILAVGADACLPKGTAVKELMREMGLPSAK
jgi:excisionase family DNA binding protein